MKSESKKEIILINLPSGSDYHYGKTGETYPATGIMVIGSILRKNGFPVSLVDAQVDPCYESVIFDKLSDDVIFVGFSIMTSQVIKAYELAKKIKEVNPDIPIIFGGVHPTLFPKQTVDNPYIDIAVVNEGAETVLEIMDYFAGKRELEDIKGIAFCDRNGNVKITEPRELDDISQIPYFDFDLLDVPKYLNATSVYEREFGNEKIKLMPILTGLGCCFRCDFCINVILKRRYRTRSAISIVQEIKKLQSRYGANAFLFLDEDFCINKRRLIELIQLVKAENLKFLGRIWSRVSYFNNNLFKALVPEMERIGIKSIAMGAESGSQKMLDYMHKDIKREDIVCAVGELAKTKITARLSFMTCMPNEEKEDTFATYRLCSKLLKINPFTDISGPFIFRYYPGSPIFEEMIKKYNIKLPESIEGWKGRLYVDGALIVDVNQWVWDGFFKYHESMQNYLRIYTAILSKPKHQNSLFAKIIRRIFVWRLSHGSNFYVIDLYFFRFIKKVKMLLSGIKSPILRRS